MGAISRNLGEVFLREPLSTLNLNPPSCMQRPRGRAGPDRDDDRRRDHRGAAPPPRRRRLRDRVLVPRPPVPQQRQQRQWMLQEGTDERRRMNVNSKNSLPAMNRAATQLEIEIKLEENAFLIVPKHDIAHSKNKE